MKSKYTECSVRVGVTIDVFIKMRGLLSNNMQFPKNFTSFFYQQFEEIAELHDVKNVESYLKNIKKTGVSIEELRDALFKAAALNQYEELKELLTDKLINKREKYYADSKYIKKFFP